MNDGATAVHGSALVVGSSYRWCAAGSGGWALAPITGTAGAGLPQRRHHSSFMLSDSSADARAIVLRSPCTGRLPRSYRGLGRGYMTIYRSWEVSMAPSSPRAGSARARHDDPSARPHDPPRPPLSQRSFLWPKRLTAGGAAAKEASSGAVGPGEALGTLVTISGYVKRPRYARLNTPMGADGAISCMSCAS